MVADCRGHVVNNDKTNGDTWSLDVTCYQTWWIYGIIV